MDVPAQNNAILLDQKICINLSAKFAKITQPKKMVEPMLTMVEPGI
jgi:hypothetical protein